METRELILAGVIPGAVTLAVLLGTWVLCLGSKEERQPRWAAPLAFGAAYFPAFYAINPSFAWWPADATYRMPHAAALMLMLGLYEATSKPTHSKRRRAISLLVFATAASFFLIPIHWDEKTALALWLGGALLVWWIHSSLLHKQAARHPGWRLPFMLALIPLAASPVIFYGSWGWGALHAGTLTAMCAAAAISACIITKQSISNGATSILLALLMLLLLIALNYADANPISVGLIMIAPLALLAKPKQSDERTNAWVPVVVQLVAIAIPLGLAVAIAFTTRPEPYMG
ncbi:MAG: hypothetical protein ACYTF7_02440 [Planctomycetota bacterium]|jgi:hypothetical protein